MLWPDGPHLGLTSAAEAVGGVVLETKSSACGVRTELSDRDSAGVLWRNGSLSVLVSRGAVCVK